MSSVTKSHLVFFLLLLNFFSSSCTRTERYAVDDCLTPQDIKQVIDTGVRYMAKLPPMATRANKFESRFDAYYRSVATDYDLRLCYKTGEVFYILFTRAARSITPMREAIGCKIKWKNGRFEEYEEVFRTWKMEDEILKERCVVLFEKMVAGESLEPYYSKNKGDQYIEFPDDRFYFDKKSRTWRDHVFDSIPR